MGDGKLANTSYVLIHSLPDGTWLAETPTYPAAKGQGSTPDKALDALIHSIMVIIAHQSTNGHTQ
jgi:predicted RNase H-like HicB family nuclease